MQRLFDESILVLTKVLDLRSARHEILAANLANADTPGYRAVDLVFEEELSRAVGSASLAKTHAKHFPLGPSAAGIRGRIEPDWPVSMRLDGNSVGVERQMVKLAENTLMYEASAQMLIKRFRGLKEAIREGR